MFRHRSVAAFTLIELLTVLAIISVLASLVFVGAGRSREAARSVACQSNLRSIGMGLLLYAVDHGALPPGKVWDTAAAPYTGGVEDASSMAIYRCPVDALNRKRSDARSYTASGQKASSPGSGVFSLDSTTLSLRMNQFDRPSATILVSELFGTDNVQFKSPFSWSTGWLREQDMPKKSDGSYYHAKGMNFLFADGHVEQCTPSEIFNYNGISSGRWRAYQP